jgi:acyl carrier protein
VPAETHSHGRRLERGEVAELVVDRLADLLGRDADDIRPELRLRDDLDADDLLVLDLVEAVEQELGERMVGLSLDDDALGELRTVGDAIDCVCEHLGVGPDA